MTQVTADAPVDAEVAEPKKGKLGLILGLVGAFALGGGGFFAVHSGMINPAALFGGGGEAEGHGAAEAPAGHGEAEGSSSGVSFVPLDPVVVSLPPGASARLLRFSGQLEVAPEDSAAVAAMMPRVLDVLNTFLRAVEPSDLENPAALAPLRAQMLRRIQVVTGEGKVHDLLITEFVLN